MGGKLGRHVCENEGFDVGGLCHLGDSYGTGLSVIESLRFERGLVVGAVGEHDIGIARKFDHRVAGFSIAGDDERLAGRGVDAVCEGIEVGLDMGSFSSGDFPFLGVPDETGSDVTGVNDWWIAGESAASVHVYVLADREVDAGVPVMGEDAFLFIHDAVN